MENTQTVKEIFAAFGRGDAAGILDRVAGDVAWEIWDDNSAQRAGVPWLLPRHGKAGVAEFLGVLSQMKFHKFEIGSLMEGDDKVVSELAVDIELANGVRFQDEELLLWKFNKEGKVCGFRHYADTAKQVEAGRQWPK